MKKADLEKLGLTADAIKKADLPENLIEEILKLNGLAVETQKSKVTAAEEKATALQGQLDEANKAIEGFKDLKPEELKKSADDWKAKYEKAQADAKQAAKEAEDKVKAVEFDTALDGALRDAKAKNPKSVKALLKVADLKITEDGTFSGLNEQLEKIKADNDFLFSEDEGTPAVVKGANATKVSGDAMVAAMRSGAGLNETKETN